MKVKWLRKALYNLQVIYKYIAKDNSEFALNWTLEKIEAKNG